MNGQVTGQSFVGRHYVNGWFATAYEIGFSGGSVNVVSIAQDIISIEFDFVFGPTYHIASFRGLAGQTGDHVYEHSATISGSSGPCVLGFAFENGGLSITDVDNGFNCQFGGSW